MNVMTSLGPLPGGSGGTSTVCTNDSSPRKSDDLGGSLDHLTAVNADLASQVQRVEIG